MQIIKKVKATYGPQSKIGGHQEQSRLSQLFGVGICLVALWGLAHISTGPPQEAQAAMTPKEGPTATHGKAWTKNELREIAMLEDEAVGNPQYLTPCVITQESGWNLKARSEKGAMGLTQVMPADAKLAHINPYDPAQAIRYTARRLHFAINCHHGDVGPSLASYNGSERGAAHLKRHGWHVDNKMPSYAWQRETANYVRIISDCILREQLKNG